jgi:hypothetical protein
MLRHTDPRSRETLTVWRAVAVAVTAFAMHASDTSAQSPAAAPDTLGTVVRLHRTRTELTPGSKGESSKRTGMLIRQQGELQRVDMLESVSDSSGAQWGTMTQRPFGMMLHDRARRASVSMEFDDLKRLFVDVLHVQVDSLVAEADVVGAGPAVLGYETIRVRLRRQFIMRARWNNNLQRIQVTTTSDELIAPALPGAAGANTVLSMTAGSSAALVESIFGVGSADVRVRGAARLPDGLVLRSASRSRTVSTGPAFTPLFAAGSSESGDSVEVVAVERRALPATLFEAPVGYTRTTLATQLQGLLTLLDESGTAGPIAPLPPAGKQRKQGKPIKP